MSNISQTNTLLHSLIDSIRTNYEKKYENSSYEYIGIEINFLKHLTDAAICSDCYLQFPQIGETVVIRPSQSLEHIQRIIYEMCDKVIDYFIYRQRKINKSLEIFKHKHRKINNILEEDTPDERDTEQIKH